MGYCMIALTSSQVVLYQSIKWYFVVQNLHPHCPDVTTVKGIKPLDWARDEGHTEVVDYLKSLPQSSSQPGEQPCMDEWA